MIVWEKYVFLHFPKTWGTFVRYLLWKYSLIIQSGRSYEKSLPDIGNCEDKYFFWFVRNPYDFYVSLFYYSMIWDHKWHNPMLRFCSNNFQDSFLITMKKLLDPQKYMTQVEYYIYVKYLQTTNGQGLFGVWLQTFINMKNKNIWMYSQIYEYVYQRSDFWNADIHIFQYEKLYESFEKEICQKIWLSFECVKNDFSIQLNVNPIKSSIPCDEMLFDDDLKRLIFEKDKIIFDMFWYEKK